MEDYQLHRLGWKAFQDLCIAVVEERTGRPVQTFLPSNDAGRDGAFVGRWDDREGNSTIQCKFTSKNDKTLTLSMLDDELPKVRRLARKKLADDYIIITNCTVTGASELKIREAFEQAGAGRCRVFHRDWIIERIRDSARLRMMVPRLYGLMDLASVLDRRAYRQAQLILSEMGDNLQKLVVTDAHRKSVRAISNHNVVLLLGSPAAGKSTIGASLALGANDIWKCTTIKSTSPQHLEQHLDPEGGQFFWIDDAWGSTQFQRDRTEPWNQVFPLMQSALKKGTRFLITSRDYIWNSAKSELKLQAFPILRRSQVIINVHDLTIEERARILYNHVKLGDQNKAFRNLIREFLPQVANAESFLPESARRLGTRIFTDQLLTTEKGVLDFFERPKEFLEQTIEGLSPAARAAIGLVFLNGGTIRSPVPLEKLDMPAAAFDATPAQTRTELQSLNGSLLNLAQDEDGPYWTYRHPTVGDAFASYIAKSPELVELYLRGAKPETILREVVCAGIQLKGAAVTVPSSLNKILVQRISSLSALSLAVFICYRANAVIARMLLKARPDLLNRIDYISSPIREDIDSVFAVALHRYGLLGEEERLKYVEIVRRAAVDEADDSLIESPEIRAILTNDEYSDVLSEVRSAWMDDIPAFVDHLRSNWDNEYAPDDYFDRFKTAAKNFTNALSSEIDVATVTRNVDVTVRSAIFEMQLSYEEPSSTVAPLQQSEAKQGSLEDLFRDVSD
jgi:hypothetical protein